MNAHALTEGQIMLALFALHHWRSLWDHLLQTNDNTAAGLRNLELFGQVFYDLLGSIRSNCIIIGGLLKRLTHITLEIREHMSSRKFPIQVSRPLQEMFAYVLNLENLPH